MKGSPLSFYLRPFALSAEFFGVVDGFAPAEFEYVTPHEFPVADMVDLHPLLLTGYGLLVKGNGLQRENTNTQKKKKFMYHEK